jgi:hypothetical protein
VLPGDDNPVGASFPVSEKGIRLIPL